ncbi:MAG TPA: hypothetical protein VGQ62_25095 [Chloroflexota bacterium]|nr:hypothetical protein [Chloroflexota bacterium]
MNTISADRIVAVADFSVETLCNIQDHLRISNSFEHCAYREAELDEIWRLLDMRKRVATGAELQRLTQMLEIIWQAHDLVGLGRPLDAARALGALVQPQS